MLRNFRLIVISFQLKPRRILTPRWRQYPARCPTIPALHHFRSWPSSHQTVLHGQRIIHFPLERRWLCYLLKWHLRYRKRTQLLLSLSDFSFILHHVLFSDLESYRMSVGRTMEWSSRVKWVLVLSVEMFLFMPLDFFLSSFCGALINYFCICINYPLYLQIRVYEFLNRRWPFGASCLKVGLIHLRFINPFVGLMLEVKLADKVIKKEQIRYCKKYFPGAPIILPVLWIEHQKKVTNSQDYWRRFSTPILERGRGFFVIVNSFSYLNEVFQRELRVLWSVLTNVANNYNHWT